MAEYKLRLPSMGEGVMEATVTSWLKNPGDEVEEDESVVEVATDKVDSDIPIPVAGELIKIIAEPDSVVKVGEVLAVFKVDELPEEAMEELEETSTNKTQTIQESEPQPDEAVIEIEQSVKLAQSTVESQGTSYQGFLSPLVKAIIETENISAAELENIKGSGSEGRITKLDIQNYLTNRDSAKVTTAVQAAKGTEISKNPATTKGAIEKVSNQPVALGKGEEVIEMDRMRKLIAQHMIDSKRTSPHVSSFIEVDMTNIVLWRNQIKDKFLAEEGEKFTFMPIFVQAIAHAIQKFPMINVSVDGTKIIKKPNINIGIATALPSGNLIVPVVKNANDLNLRGLAKRINDLAQRARNNNLKPDDIQGGTYTLTNIGSFGNILGTPIINQPQVAIMAVGAIQKKPAVIETPQGDLIGIRHKMYLSHTYDHRVVDGALGGMFVKEVADWLEAFSLDTEI